MFDPQAWIASHTGPTFTRQMLIDVLEDGVYEEILTPAQVRDVLNVLKK